MKIRIRGNSVRFRLTRGEVEKLCTEGVVVEKTFFNEKVFFYTVKLSPKHHELDAEFDGDAIRLFLPVSVGASWQNNEQVGFSNIKKVRGDTELHILLEKDYTCLTDRGEDETDNYPNPKATG